MSAALGRLLHRSSGPVSKLHVVVAARPTLRLAFRPNFLQLAGSRTKATAATEKVITKTITTPKSKPKAKAATTATTKKTTTAKKPAATTAAAKKAAPKKAASKKAASKKAAPKKKTAGKKKAAPKKVLTDEQKAAKKQRAQKIRDIEKRKMMKEFALKPPCRPSVRLSGFNVYVSQTATGTGRSLITKDTAEDYNRFSDDEKTKYTNLAKSKLESLRAAYRAFIESHTAEEIRKANIARRWLQKQGVRGYKDMLVDHRTPKRPSTAFLTFYTAMFHSFEGNSIGDKAKEAGRQWTAMTDAEKKPYADTANSRKERYGAEKAAYDKI